MTRRLVVQPHLCIGCKSCELACAFSHGSNGSPGASRCITETVGPDEYVPMLCIQCAEAACVKVCPTGALGMDAKTGIVRLHRERCVRCMACTVACPFGNMHFDPSQQTVHKCDLCSGAGDYPRCSMFCPTKALTVEDAVDDLPAADPAA